MCSQKRKSHAILETAAYLPKTFYLFSPAIGDIPMWPFFSTRKRRNTSLSKAFDSIVTAMENGDLSARADLEAFSGEDEKILAGLNSILDAVIGPLNVAAEYVDRIRRGRQRHPRYRPGDGRGGRWKRGTRIQQRRTERPGNRVT